MRFHGMVVHARENRVDSASDVLTNLLLEEADHVIAEIVITSAPVVVIVRLNVVGEIINSVAIYGNDPTTLSARVQREKEIYATSRY